MKSANNNEINKKNYLFLHQQTAILSSQALYSTSPGVWVVVVLAVDESAAITLIENNCLIGNVIVSYQLKDFQQNQIEVIDTGVYVVKGDELIKVL